jgi:hypothetical protein
MPLATTPSQQCVNAYTKRSKLALRVETRVSGVGEKPSYWLENTRPMAAAIKTNNMKKSQESLKKWTEQKWRTSDNSPSKGKKRYLPDAAWSALSPAEKAATNRAKAKGNKAGKQFVKQPKKIANKTSKYR